MPVRTVAVWCPDWPVVAAAAAGGVRPHEPVAVLAANRVVACSASARANGVRRGLRRREAQGRCPELVVLPDDPGRDARTFEPVVCAIEDLVAGVEVIRPGLAVLEARGSARYFGSESNLAERIIDTVAAKTGVECQVGIADGIFAATLAAHRGVTVAPGTSPQFLAPLAITELCHPADPGVWTRSTMGHGRPTTEGRSRSGHSSAELVDLLRRLGLRTLGAFAALPVRDVASRFGVAAVRAHRLASGADERPVGKRQPPIDLTVTQRFDPPIERVDAVAFAAQQPAARLHDLLAARGLAGTRLRVYAQTDHGEELARVWRCAEPLTPSAIADRVRWQLDAWLSGRQVSLPDELSAGLSAGIVLLRLVPEEVVPVGALQHGLWGETGQRDERAGRAMVRVQGMLGPDAVCTAVLGGGRDPAQRVTLVPWGDELVPAHTPDASWPGQLPQPFPATVPAGPPPVDVLDEHGREVGVSGRSVLTGTPCRVVVGDGTSRDVLAWAGPWPVEERWWDPDAARRRARLQVVLDAAEEGHAALLLACEGGRWRVEGVYD